MHKTYLSLGSNIGDRRENLREAIKNLKENGVKVVKISSVYETAPVGYLDQDKFLNIACLAETDYSPEGLLTALKGIETRMGRQKTVRFGPRNIDIDIIYYDDVTMSTRDLIIPHPRMHERAFVLVPLCEIAKDYLDPVRKRAVKGILKDVSCEGVRFYSKELSKMYELTIRGHFSSAHALRGYKGKCENMHGHTFRTAVVIRSDKLNDIGIVYDFTELKKHLNGILDELDHHVLNDLPYFETVNPSSENLAVYIYDRMKAALAGDDVEVVSAEVWESDSSSAKYLP